MTRLWVFGGGGHAKSVIDSARSSGQFEVVGILDDGYVEEGQHVSGVPVRGRIDEDCIGRFGIQHAVVAIGDNRTRAAVSGRFDAQVHWATVVHRVAYVAPSATLSDGAVVLAGAVIQPDAVVGRHAIANTSCSIGHDCSIGDFVHVAPGTNIAGGATVEEGVFLGIGSRIIPLCTVREWSTVGAGAVVINDIPAHVTAAGIPARPLTLPKSRPD